MTDFGRYADSYDQEIASAISFAGLDPDFFLELKADLLVDLLRRLGDPARARVLDVGCGPGAMDSHLVGRVGAVHGLDTSRSMVARASARNPGATYGVCEPDRLPCDSGSFELAFASCVLHHVVPGSWPRFTAELVRVVRPGGLVAVLEHNPLNPLTRLVVSRCAFDEDAELLALRKVKRLLGDAGATALASRYIVFFPWQRAALRRLELRLGRLPFGAQYLVAGTRP